jgi:hypothetical protein
MESLKNKALAIIALATIISLAFGAHNYFAKAEDLRLVSIRIDQKILGDRAHQIQEEIWNIKREYGETPLERKYREKIEMLEEKKKEIEKEIDNIHKK